jgi:transcriptional regulator with XRE-family HTH domain
VLAARLAARKSVDELAADAGMKSDLLGQIESGAQKPSGAELVAVAEALGVSVERFFVGL